MARWVRYFKVSRSGYYEYFATREVRNKKQKALKHKIKQIFDESEGEYGPDRICGIIRKQGGKASYRKVSRYMADMNLNSVHNSNRTRSLTDSRKARDDTLHPNLVRGQEFDRPYQAVCSDITYLKSGEGWEYLCVVKDIATGEILGESMSARMTKELVIQAYRNAHTRHKLPPGTIFHSDRGSQYTSKAFRKLLQKYGIQQSFSRVGMPGDNSWAESFFATLKKACIRFKRFDTREDLSAEVFRWIESHYNTGRVQKRLGYRSPREYRELLMSNPMVA